MLLIIRFEGNREKKIPHVTYFEYDGSLFSYEKEEDPLDGRGGSFSASEPALKVDTITVLSKGAVLKAETEAYSIHRNVTNLSCKPPENRFLGNLAYAGAYKTFNITET